MPCCPHPHCYLMLRLVDCRRARLCSKPTQRLAIALRYLSRRALLLLPLLMVGCSTASSLNRSSPDWERLRSGDTLYQLAERYNRPLACIKRYNPTLNAEALNAGQRILVPTSEECASLASPPLRYRVRRGDTLYAVAAHFNLAPRAIAAANPPLSHSPRLEIGQWLILPQLQRSAATLSSQPSAVRTSSPSRPLATAAHTPPAPAHLPNAIQQCPWPLLEPRVIREFGPDQRGRLQPMMLAARTSQTAMAIADGSVQFASTMRQLGHVVVVHHAHNIQAVYAHCGKIDVRVGQRVTAGTPLCQVAQDDITASPQLLFDIRLAGRPIDPRRLLK